MAHEPAFVGLPSDPVLTAALTSHLLHSLHALTHAPAEAVWEQRLQQRIPLQYLTATAFWRDIVLSGDILAAWPARRQQG